MNSSMKRTFAAGELCRLDNNAYLYGFNQSLYEGLVHEIIKRHKLDALHCMCLNGFICNYHLRSYAGYVYVLVLELNRVCCVSTRFVLKIET